MGWFEIVVSLIALTVLEIVLGIDNLVLLSVLTDRLPREERKRARFWGLTFAWVTRLLLLASAVWLMKLNVPLLTFEGFMWSARDIFFIVGGAFLLMKATQEIHEALMRQEIKSRAAAKKASLYTVVIQVGLMDVIFSLDSVMTAIGLTEHFFVMAFAITLAILVMVFASHSVSRIIEKYPTLKMLALSFLMLIGTVLVADGFSFHIPRGYVYFAMGFSFAVESLNLVMIHRKRRKMR